MHRRILVAGMGKGGHAFAGTLAQSGHDVVVMTSDPKKKEFFEAHGNSVLLTGIRTGSGKLEEVVFCKRGTSPPEGRAAAAVKESDIILIITDATVHRDFAEKLAPLLSGQHVVLTAAGIGGALEFQRAVKRLNPSFNGTVSETDTLLYACQVPQTGTSYIKAEKKTVIFTTLRNDARTVSELQHLFPQFHYVPDPLMGIDDSPVLHVVGMVMNADRIRAGEDFNFYLDGTTPEVAETMQKMDEERCRVGEKLGIACRSLRNWIHKAYGVQIGLLHEMIHAVPPYQNTKDIQNRSPAPKTLQHRYLTEEIPLKVVPLEEIGRIIGVLTPLYSEMIDKVDELLGTDYRRTGRTLADMGLTEEHISNWPSQRELVRRRGRSSPPDAGVSSREAEQRAQEASR